MCNTGVYTYTISSLFYFSPSFGYSLCNGPADLLSVTRGARREFARVCVGGGGILEMLEAARLWRKRGQVVLVSSSCIICIIPSDLCDWPRFFSFCPLLYVHIVCPFLFYSNARNRIPPLLPSEFLVLSLFLPIAQFPFRGGNFGPALLPKNVW